MNNYTKDRLDIIRRVENGEKATLNYVAKQKETLIIFYKLNENKTPIRCDVEEWSQMINDTESRRVRSDYIGDIHISTVFLGTPLSYDYCKDDLLMFETMIFGNTEHEQYCQRYATWDEAVKGHYYAVELIKDELRLSK